MLLCFMMNELHVWMFDRDGDVGEIDNSDVLLCNKIMLLCFTMFDGNLGAL